jgi:uncharacterized protein YqeY
MEVYTSGKGGDMLSVLAKATAQILFDLGDKFAEFAQNEQSEEEFAEIKGDDLTLQDKAEITVINNFKKLLDTEVALVKIDRTAKKAGIDELPDFVKDIIMSGLEAKAKEILEGQNTEVSDDE